MPTETVTHCFSTRDAVERGEGTLTFDFPGSRNGVQKVMLGSLEFPITQWTVEERWNRLYLSEALHVAPDGRELVFRAAGGELRVALPLTLNPCRISRAVPCCDLAVVCEHPHGLFVEGEPLALWRCRLLATPVGDVDLSQHTLLPVDETTFVVKNIQDAAGLASAVGRGCLHCPVTHSPQEICKLLDEASARHALLRLGCDLRFRYDAAADRVRLRLRPQGAGRRAGQVALADTPLARVLGLAPIAWTPTPDEDWPSERTQLWDYVDVEPGFYAPAHRPMSIGPPGRLPDALELAANRMYFPLLGGEGIERFHLIVFADPEGTVFRSRILPGHFVPQELAAHIERGMNGAVDGTGIAFRVEYREERFVFSCEREHRGAAEPVAFSLFFHHPNSIDPARLGFPACHFAGEAVYASPTPVHVPARPVSGTAAAARRGLRNLLRVQDIAKQKRFRFSATAIPALVAVVLGTPEENQTTVVTYVNREPFSHGLVVGDVVALTPYVEPAHADGGEPLAASTDGPLPSKCSAVVVATNGVAELTLVTPAIPALRQPRTAFHIVAAPRPWSLNFSEAVPRAIRAHMLGFLPRTYCWGVDGESAPLRSPPYLAPHVHNLDHPDYVLITLTSANGGAIEHTYNGSSRNVFCKLTLYPLFREERMLPRDAPTVGPSMGRFTLGFHNPDWTPYQFHGAEFSFSLNLMIATPDA